MGGEKRWPEIHLQAKDKEEGKAASLGGLLAELKIWKYQVHKYSDPLLKLFVSSVNFNIFCDYDFFTHYTPSDVNYCFSQKERLFVNRIWM